MNGILLILLIYSGFSINLMLQCALGIKGPVESKDPLNLHMMIRLSIIFFCIILLWFFFSRILYNLIPGMFIYVLLFPVSAVIYNGIEYLIFKYAAKKDIQDNPIVSFPGGITAVSVFICINLANGIIETVFLSFGFTCGIFLVGLIIREIRCRAALEEVPFFLRGKPLVLVAMGLLSLIFTTVSLLFFRMIGIE